MRVVRSEKTKYLTAWSARGPRTNNARKGTGAQPGEPNNTRDQSGGGNHPTRNRPGGTHNPTGGPGNPTNKSGPRGTHTSNQIRHENSLRCKFYMCAFLTLFQKQVMMMKHKERKNACGILPCQSHIPDPKHQLPSQTTLTKLRHCEAKECLPPPGTAKRKNACQRPSQSGVHTYMGCGAPCGATSDRGHRGLKCPCCWGRGAPKQRVP